MGERSWKVTMTAVNMYQDPVLSRKTFDVEGKKVGYLCYNSFDLKSSSALPEAFSSFKEEGVSELIVDLRYNGGGYSFTETVLASLLAPGNVVSEGRVFQTEIYNDYLSAAWEKEGYDTNTYFSFKHESSSGGENISIDLTDSKVEFSKLYFIVTGSSASASEGLIVGLGPYCDMTLIGEETSGKYCAGIVLVPENFYIESYDCSLIKDWGMYVMVSKFADAYGRNAAEPDGLGVDIEAFDNPLDGYVLGDENESMLRVALTAAGKKYVSAASQTPKVAPPPLNILERGPGRGILVKTPPARNVRK